METVLGLRGWAADSFSSKGPLAGVHWLGRCLAYAALPEDALSERMSARLEVLPTDFQLFSVSV